MKNPSLVSLQLVLVMVCVYVSEQVYLESELLNQLIEKTFNGYTCLNVYIHHAVQIRRPSVVREIHQMNYSVLLLDTFYMANENCGFILVSDDVKVFRFVKDFTNVNFRILHISESSDEALTLFEEEPILFEDNDILLVELADNINILVKSRYDTDFEPSSIHVEATFFYSKNHVPVKLNLNRRTVKVVTFNCPLFGSINGVELGDGVETRIFKEVVRKLNFTYQVLLPTAGERWGTAYQNGTISGGIIKDLFTRRADMGFCTVWIESSKCPYLTFSTYWNMVCLKFFVPKPKMISTHWNSIFKPLPATLWMLVLLAAVITTSVCVALQYIHNQLFSRTMKGSRSNIGQTFISIIGSLLLAKSSNQTRSDNAHQNHLLLWWSIFAMVITNLYSSSLVSHLTYPQFESMPDTIESMVKAGYYWGTPYDPNSDQVFDSGEKLTKLETPVKDHSSIQNPWHVAFINRYVFESHREDRLKRLLAGNYTLFVKCIGDKNYMEVDNLPSNLLHDLRTTHGCMKSFMIGFVYRKQFPYAVAVSSIISNLVESGITLYWMDRVFEQKYSSTTFQKLYEYKIPPEDIELTSLSVQSLQGAFFLLAAGVGLAAIAFIGELVKGRKVKSC